MLVAHLGDTVVMMVKSQSLDKADPIPFHYTLVFRDMPTGQTAEISYEGENDAVQAFAAWLVADEFDVGFLDKIREDLYAKLPRVFRP
jgi:hypothetical protein